MQLFVILPNLTMERIVLLTDVFMNFYHSLNPRAKKKVKYILEVMGIEKNVSAKLVKKLVNTEFYEMRVSTENEYRTIIFTMDADNFAEATQILLLNGFMKKSTNDYSSQIRKAREILEKELYGKD